MNSLAKVPAPVNEPILDYAPGSPERKSLKAKLKELRSTRVDVPLFIGGRELRTKSVADQVCPHDHRHVLGRFHRAGRKEVSLALSAAKKAAPEWAAMPFGERAAIFLKAADLLAGPYRATLNAATMLCQSKNVFQAEIDSACELIDFWRFNVHYAERLYAEQPLSSRSVWNRLEYRPLEGFVLAVTPFNFTSIAGNLPTAPALMGNTVVWKPASVCVYTAHFIMEILRKAGLPDGVVNLVAGSGPDVADVALQSPDLAGVHFTGSTAVFRSMWKSVGANIAHYKTYPRLVGETGGKDFIFVHPSADLDAVATAMVRGAFEYQGQKCSAASRAYVPRSMWAKLKLRVGEMLAEVKMGGVEDFTNFVNAVIDASAFRKHKAALAYARGSSGAKVVFGGGCDDSKGYFVQPTLIEASDPRFRTMVEELFGPILTVYVYPDRSFAETLRLCDETSPYALTGSIFATERSAVIQASRALLHAAGNFYINDKPTGAVVGQQPFGGSRASGTNDKAGSGLNLVRWVSVRTLKENFLPPRDFKYPFLLEP